MHIKDLKPDPQNRRSHNPRNVGMIVDGLHRVGAARSIVIDEDDVVLAGNGVIEAAAEAGITAVRIIEASGEEIIAVRRTGLSAEQKRALAIYDNRTSELATWDIDQLRQDAADGLDLQPFWSDAEIAILTGVGVEPEWVGMPEFAQSNIKAFRSILCHFDTQEDFEAFIALTGQTVTDTTKFLRFPPESRRKRLDVEFAGEDGEQEPEPDSLESAD